MTNLHWADDALLPGFEAAQLPAWVPTEPRLRSRLDAAGRPDPVLTLVRPVNNPPQPLGVVVHLHGYNDYFFDASLPNFFPGWAFLAVDARRCGRSLRPEEVPHYQVDLREQASDLGRAVAVARQLYPRLPVVIHGHSTGGLVAALWSHAHRKTGGPDGLVLNSPFLTMERSWIQPFTDQALPTLARQSPLRSYSDDPSQYAARLLHRWEFDPNLKRPQGVPARGAWVAAVRSAQLRLQRGLDVQCPVLVGYSSCSAPDLLEDPRIDTCDTVLDVSTMADLGRRIGPRIQLAQITGAIHDLSLSLPEPRAAWQSTVGEFLAQVRSEPATAKTAAPRWPLPSTRRQTPPAVIGHRGSSWIAPQNTLPAFEASARSGATAIEFDLQLSADGVVVVIHDEQVDATTDGYGAVHAHTAAQLAELDAGSWFSSYFADVRIPTWDQMLELARRHPDLGLLVELKGDWSTEQVRAVTQPLTAEFADRCIVESFSRVTVGSLAAVAPALPRGLLVEEPADDLLEIAEQLEVTCVNPAGTLVAADPHLVERLHDAGYQVMVWTIDEEWMWLQALHLHVDAIVTNRPEHLGGWLSGRKKIHQ